MAYTTLNSLLTAIADAIRSKKGTTAQINAQNFPSEIASIETSVKSQTVSLEVSLGAGGEVSKVFTFDTLTEVYGVTKVERPFIPNTTGAPYPSHQILDPRFYQDYSPITISGNTVTLRIGSRVGTTSKATWTVTAVGK